MKDLGSVCVKQKRKNTGKKDRCSHINTTKSQNSHFRMQCK